MKTLLGGVGYSDLSDFSLGPLLVADLQEEPWPKSVTVEDLSYGPVAVLHRLADENPPFGRLVVVGAERRGRAPGCLTAYRWDQALPDAEEIQSRVGEAVTGVISLDNLLVIVAALGAAPREVYVVEIEPRVEAMGHELSAPVRLAVTRAAQLLREIALGLAEGRFPESPLGGYASLNSSRAASAATNGGPGP